MSNTKYKPQIICPYCEHVEQDSWEWDRNHTYECGNCGKQSNLTVDITIDYSTTKIEETEK